MKKKTKKSKIQFLSATLGTLYSLFLVDYFMGSLEDISGSIATALVTPHMLCCVLAAIFGWVGFFGNGRGFALTAAILYCVGAVLFVMYAPFVVPMIVTGFIGYAMIGRIKKANE